MRFIWKTSILLQKMVCIIFFYDCISQKQDIFVWSRILISYYIHHTACLVIFFQLCHIWRDKSYKVTLFIIEWFMHNLFYHVPLPHLFLFFSEAYHKSYLQISSYTKILNYSFLFVTHEKSIQNLTFILNNFGVKKKNPYNQYLLLYFWKQHMVINYIMIMIMSNHYKLYRL